MNKYIEKDIGKNALSTYKRASNILDREKKNLGKPDAVLFRYEEEKSFLKKLTQFERLLQ